MWIEKDTIDFFLYVLQILKYYLLKERLDYLLKTADFLSHFRIPVRAARHHVGERRSEVVQLK